MLIGAWGLAYLTSRTSAAAARLVDSDFVFTNVGLSQIIWARSHLIRVGRQGIPGMALRRRLMLPFGMGRQPLGRIQPSSTL